VVEQTAEERASGKLVVVTEPVAGESVLAAVGKIEVVELELVEQTEVVGQIGVEWTVGELLVGDGTGVEWTVVGLLAGKGNEYVGEDLVDSGRPGAVVERVVGEQIVGLAEEQIC